MKKENLTLEDIDLILESLAHTRTNFDSTEYPTAELRRERFSALERVSNKVRQLRNVVLKRQHSAD